MSFEVHGYTIHVETVYCATEDDFLAAALDTVESFAPPSLFEQWIEEVEYDWYEFGMDHYQCSHCPIPRYSEHCRDFDPCDGCFHRD